jgi:hypothetical protein
MSKPSAKTKFNILFNKELVESFQSNINMKSGFTILSKQHNSENSSLKIKFIQRLGSLCGGIKQGLDEYLLDSIEHSHNPIYNTVDISIDYVYIRDTRGKVCAILLAHRGECQEVPSWWTVRLICNKQEENCKGMAAKLLGLYTYALKIKQVQKYGLLEIADNYENIAGYCLYSRFGFEETNIQCKAFMWLTLANNLEKITYDQIIETVKTGKQQIKDTGSTLYCKELKQASIEKRLPKPRNDPMFKVERDEDHVYYQDESSKCIIL